MKLKKHMLILMLIMVIGVILSACGNSDNNKANAPATDNDNNQNSGTKLAKDQTFNFNIKNEPPTLNPAKVKDTTTSVVVDQIFEGLTRIGEDGEPEKAMASDIDISDDQMTYTFTIRDGATWSNGDPVTAEDFAYAWKWVLNPESPDVSYAYQLYPIKGAQDANEGKISLDDVGITVKDDHTLVVELEQPTPYFLQLTAFYTFYPLDKKVVKGKDKWAVDKGEEFVTNGPFTLEEWKHKNEITLKKNPTYWDKDSVDLETIHMFMINDENTELEMYKNGKLDWAGSPTGDIPLAAIQSLKADGSLNIEPKAAVNYYELNTNEVPFNNKNIRKAFSLAINRAGITKNILKGGQVPAMALVPPTMFKDNTKGYFKDNDVEKAKKLLKKGMDELGIDKLPEITLSYNTDESNAKIAQAVQEMWKDNLGVKVRLSNTEWKVFLSSMKKGDFQIGRAGWAADFNDPINFLEIFQTAGGSNDTGWEDEEYTQLLDQSRTETDKVKRHEILKNAEEILMDNMPIIPIYYYTDAWLNQDYVKGVHISPIGNFNLKWAHIAAH